MNIGNEFIPVETSTTQTSTTTTSATATSTMTTSVMLSSEIIPTTMAEITSEKPNSSYPPGVKREILIKGLSEIEKDIFIISLSGLVLMLMILLVVICIRWRKSRGHRYEFQNMSAGSSMTIFDSSKID